MMGPADALWEIAARCESHAGDWDSRMDEAIARALGWDEAEDGWHEVGVFAGDGRLRRTAYAVALPAFTLSLDAAMTLLRPPGHPLWTARLDVWADGRGVTCRCEVTVPSREQRGSSSCRPALAVCAAALRARAAFALA